MLEECGLPYEAHSVDLGRGEQREPWFVELSPARPRGQCPYSDLEPERTLYFLSPHGAATNEIERHCRRQVTPMLHVSVDTDA